MYMSREATDRRRRAVILGVIGAVAAVALVAALALSTVGGDEPTPPATEPTPTPTSSTDAAAASSCGLPDGAMEPLTTAPDTTWTLTGRMAAPSSEEAGPGVDEGGVHSCFARSATGALFSAANFAADAQNPDVDGRSLLEERLLRDERYEELTAQGVGSGAGGAGGEVQLSGFRVDSASAEQVTLQLVFRADDGAQQGALVAITYNLRWSDGDWRVVLPPEGQGTATQVASLSGYVMWSGT